MSNNAPDYDNLAFEPKTTWEELKKWAKDFCKKNVIYFEIFPGENNCFWAGELCFFDSGMIKDVGGLTIAENRSFDQFKTIIKVLYEE